MPTQPDTRPTPIELDTDQGRETVDAWPIGETPFAALRIPRGPEEGLWALAHVPQRSGLFKEVFHSHEQAVYVARRIWAATPPDWRRRIAEGRPEGAKFLLQFQPLLDQYCALEAGEPRAYDRRELHVDLNDLDAIERQLAEVHSRDLLRAMQWKLLGALAKVMARIDELADGEEQEGAEGTEGEDG